MADNDNLTLSDFTTDVSELVNSTDTSGIMEETVEECSTYTETGFSVVPAPVYALIPDYVKNPLTNMNNNTHFAAHKDWVTQIKLIYLRQVIQVFLLY